MLNTHEKTFGEGLVIPPEIIQELVEIYGPDFPEGVMDHLHHTIFQFTQMPGQEITIRVTSSLYCLNLLYYLFDEFRKQLQTSNR